jgi:hypothetical protein
MKKARDPFGAGLDVLPAYLAGERCISTGERRL